MGRKKEYFLVIDTETCNSIEEPIPYDIGYAICDREGNIYEERSFIVAEVFLDMKDVMQTAYYAEKIPKYWDDIKSGKRTMKTLFNIRKQVREDMKKYGVKKVGAYNAGFDRKALNNLMRYMTKSFCRWFFPFNTQYFCIWNMACQVLMARATYIKFAKTNGLQSEKGNLQTSAEACYKYLKNKLDFVEEHTGLEDVKIEVEIMAKCFATHKKLDTTINSRCWQIPQVKRKEIESKEKGKR